MQPSASQPASDAAGKSGWRRPELHAVIGVLVVALIFLGLSARHHIAGETVSSSAPAASDAAPTPLGVSNLLDGTSGLNSVRSGRTANKGTKTAPKLTVPSIGRGASTGGSTGAVPGLGANTTPGVTLPTVGVPGVGNVAVTCRDGGPTVTISAIGIGTVILSVNNTRSSAITVDLGGLALNSVLGVLHLPATPLVLLGPGATQSVTVPLTGLPLNVVDGPLWAFTNGAPCPS